MPNQAWNLERLRAGVRLRRQRWFFRHTLELPQPDHGSARQNIASPAAALAAIERILDAAVLPFWRKATTPAEDLGYRLNHDVTGRWMGRCPQRTVAQARTLWFFSHLMATGMDVPGDDALAAAGGSFLLKRLWDGRHGGFFWEVNDRGTAPTDDRKHLYAQAFGLFALSEYAVTTKDEKAARCADHVFEITERHFHDPADGGYREVFRGDWGEISASHGTLLGVLPTVKLRNTHLHMLEALTAYYRLRPEAAVRQRINELLHILSDVAIRPAFPTGSEEHHRNWRPLHADDAALVSYGHDLESIYIAWEAAVAVGDLGLAPVALFKGLFSHAEQWGLDRKLGGFFATGRPGMPAMDRTKVWWVQAETLLAALLMFRLTGEAEYWHSFCRTLDWIVGWQTDWTYGDWHGEITPAGLARSPKAGPWKEPYHHGRALIRCRRWLRDGADAPGAGTQP